ncbi:hypothetical protein ERO13_D01G144500v2 [Gossypium hirsutum]|uniref:WUSCHEL-related homeobox 6 n=1 Tax=Gossypium hirsutum TaxID=3635 RepID=A0ABM2ZKQ7_GOSHI|nr:WUSCHEL-related homeobox 6-like [Gossypium hirsutum]KAG4162959.1 hypothetical protein ERO13_D01G144500v2 [Gossypium hirsutum]
MGYPHITDLNLSHSFNIAKPSPLDPNPTNTTNLLALNHGDLASNANEGSPTTELNSQQQQPLGSSRWNPTPEQLLTLEELYRRGTRTPSAAQIQQIATRLRRFGKIEGKNVFYWFQNHKARERQKRRRQLKTEEQQQQQCDTESLEKKESVFSLPIGCCQIKPTNEGSPSNVSKFSEEFIWTHGFAKSEGNEWMEIEEKELRMELCCTPIDLTNTTITASLDTQKNLCSFKPHQEKITTLEDENREDQTLELFPLGSNDGNGINISNKDTQVPIRAISTTPNQYFEFLPLKN